MAFRKLFNPGQKVTFTASADIAEPGFVKVTGDRQVGLADPTTDLVIGAIERPDRPNAAPVKAGDILDVTLDAAVFVVPVATAVKAGDQYGTAGVVISGAAAGAEAQVAMIRLPLASK